MTQQKGLTEQAQMIYIDQSKKTDQWHSILHSHPFAELFYVIRGTGHMKFSNVESVEMKEDDLLIVNPNVFHTEYCTEDESIEYIVIGVEGVVFDDNQLNSRYSTHNFSEYKHEVLLYLKAISNEANNKEVYHEEIITNLFNVLLKNILRRSETKLQVGSISSSYNKDCLFIETYIYENSHMDITLDHLSEVTFLDKFYLSHLFKEHSGMAPIEYLHHVRMKKAIRLLTTSDFSVSYISSMLGFANPAYFSQFFKKKQKMSPSKYRETYAIENKHKENKELL